MAQAQPSDSASLLPNAAGTVKGPGDNGNQYLFITADTRHVKIGEFVYYPLIEAERLPNQSWAKSLLAVWLITYRIASLPTRK